MGIYPKGLIGNHIVVLDSTSKNLVGLEGKILDESRESLTIDCGRGKDVILLKKSVTRIKLRVFKGDELKLSGSELWGRTSERIKG